MPLSTNPGTILNDLVSELSLTDRYRDILLPHWEESAQSLPERVPFLQPASIAAGREWCRMDPSLDERLTAAARRIENSTALRLLAWHCYRTLHDYPMSREDHSRLQQWPLPDRVLGDNAGAFFLLVALGLVPGIRQDYAAQGIEEEVIRDTCLEISCFNHNHEVATGGQPGILRNQLPWLRNYVEVKLFRVGRMEYKLRELEGDKLRVFRHRGSGVVLALAAGDTSFDPSGYRTSEDDPESWKAEFRTDQGRGTVTGAPILPTGRALRQRATLSLREWREVLGAGTMVLDMHIPSGGGMSPETCRASIAGAFDFFHRHFPDSPAEAVYCESWIFNPLWDEKLPDSNLARFMRQLYLFPVPSSGRDGFFFVFLRDYADLREAPRETRLQRLMLDTLESGGNLRSGGMFFFRDELPLFGREPYRRRIPDLVQYVDNLSLPGRSPHG